MAFSIKNAFLNVARGLGNNAGRSAAELANAAVIFELSSAFTAGGAATATVTSKAKTVNTITFTVGGIFFSKAATDNLWTLGAAGSNTTVPISSFQKYALLLDNTLAATVQEATPASASAAAVVWTNVSGLSSVAPLIQMLGNTKIVAAVLTIATNATTTFIPGTTLLGAAGITATFIDGIDPSLLPLIGNETGKVVGNGG